MFYLYDLDLTDWVEEVSIDYLVAGSPVGLGNVPMESHTPAAAYFNGLRVRVVGLFPATSLEEFRSQLRALNYRLYTPDLRPYISLQSPSDPERRVAYVSQVSLQIPSWEGGAFPVRFTWDIVTGLPWSARSYSLMVYLPQSLEDPVTTSFDTGSGIIPPGDLYTPFRFRLDTSAGGEYHFTLTASAPRGIGYQSIEWKGYVDPADPLIIRGSCLDLPVYIGGESGEYIFPPPPSNTTGVDGVLSGSPPYFLDSYGFVTLTFHQGNLNALSSAEVEWWPRYFSL